MTQIFMCRMLIEIESLPVNHIYISRTRKKIVKPADCHLDFFRAVSYAATMLRSPLLMRYPSKAGAETK